MGGGPLTQYGVLISDKGTGEQLAVLELNPSGVLVAGSFTKSVHPYSLRKIVDLIDQPIYKKYADVLVRDKALSPELMRFETQHLAELINNHSMTLCGVPILATSSQRGEGQ